MKIELTVKGSFKNLTDKEIVAGKKAVSGAFRSSAVAIKQAWRGNISAAGMGTRLGNAVRSAAYPSHTNSLNSALLVWSEAPEVLFAHETGAMIKSEDGFWLSIPFPAAGKGTKGRITPGEWEQRRGRRLAFFRRSDGTALLLDSGIYAERRYTDPLSFTASKRRNRKVGTGGGPASPIFFLTPFVKLRKRLNLRDIGMAKAGSIPGDIVSRWK